jgi:hypothetical protein
MKAGTASRTTAAPPQSRAIGNPEYGPASDLAAPFKSWIHHTVCQESDNKTEEDITMFRFLQRFGHDSQARRRGTGPMTRVRRRNHQLNCEALESRQLLSGYYIVNAASGKVLDDPGGSTSNGAVIEQWQLNCGMNQRWDILPVASGSVNCLLVNEASGKVLGDPGFSTSNGTGIIQWQWNGGRNEQWVFGGNNEIVNAYSGMVLGDPCSSTSNGTQMIQWPDNGGLNEQWKLLAVGNAPAETYYVTNASSGKVLDDPNSSTSNGTGIIQYQLNGGTNQQWTFVPLADGNFLIVNASSGEVLDDPAFSTSNGTPIEQYQLNGGLNQEWVFGGNKEIVNTSSGMVFGGNSEIVNASSGMVLDDPGFSTSNGTQIIQYQFNLGANQQWELSPME